MKATTRKWIVFYSVVLPIIALLITMVIPILRPVRGYSGPSNKGICRVQMLRIGRGMERYHTDFGSYPTGSVSEVVFALTGDNPKHQPYVEFVGRTPRSPKWKNSFVDPWNTPYKIEIVGQTNVVIQSAGFNCIFGDEDDLLFDSATEDFRVKP